jgi:hypothetical protein
VHGLWRKQPQAVIKVTGTGTATIGVQYGPSGQPVTEYPVNGLAPTPLPWSETIPINESTAGGIGVTAIPTDDAHSSHSYEIDKSGVPPLRKHGTEFGKKSPIEQNGAIRKESFGDDLQGGNTTSWDSR